MRRKVLMLAALIIPVSGVFAVALNGSVAGAATVTIKCTKITGNASTTVTISGCTGGKTGGKSKPIPSTSLAAGGKIHWVSGSVTTIAKPTLTSIPATSCPGYKSGATSNPSAEKATGTVTADKGDHLKVPGKFNGEVCISTSGAITAYPGSKLTAT